MTPFNEEFATFVLAEIAEFVKLFVKDVVVKEIEVGKFIRCVVCHIHIDGVRHIVILVAIVALVENGAYQKHTLFDSRDVRYAEFRHLNELGLLCVEYEWKEHEQKSCHNEFTFALHCY